MTSSLVSSWKTNRVVDAVQELGRKCAFRACGPSPSSARGSTGPTLAEADGGAAQVGRAEFEVMIRIVFLNPTARPCASVRRPSSRICRRVLKTSGWAFSTSSKSTTEKGLRRTASVSCPALVVADVARGRTDQAAHRVLLHVLAHVELDQRVLVVEEELGQGLGEFGLAHARGAQEDKRAAGSLGSFRPARVRRIAG